jgi:hypothetical protein
VYSLFRLSPFPFGQFGENPTVEALSHIGDRSPTCRLPGPVDPGCVIGANPPCSQATPRRLQVCPGVEIEFDPQPIREGSAVRHFICSMPGGVRLEFATPAP